MSLHKFGYTEEMHQTRTIEGMEEKQESHEKTSHTELEGLENDIMKFTKK